MKGFYIFEESLNQLRKEATVACFKLGDISHIFNTKLEPNAMVSAEVEITASVGNTITKATTNEDDTYDFETGALIALMKMCGVNKVVRACNEAFSEDTFKTYAIKYERELHERLEENKNLKEKSAELLGENSRLNYIKSCNESTIESLEKTRGLLKAENEKLKSDKDKSWKIYQRKIQKKQDRINELEAQIKASEDDKLKNIEYYEKEIKRLTEKVDSLYSYNKRLIDEIDQKNHEIIALKALKLTNESLKKDNESFRKTCEKLKEENEHLNKSISAKRVLNAKLLKDYNAAQSAYEIMVEKSADLMDKVKKLEEENEKLKLDCEKLQHGYIDTDMIFCGGRQNGKQYKALVNLFKRLPQDKIEAAYKEVFNTELPAWKKEFLNQMYGIYKESKEKAELPGTLDINGATYRKCDEKGRAVWMTDEFAFKPASKREKMWDYILKEGRTPVYVKRKDIHDFLEECQIAGIKWQSGKMPLEAAPFDLSEDDGMYFFVMTSRTPNGFRHVMTWWVAGYNEDERKAINYLPPMRWDLFKKGRLAVKVTFDNYKEFYEACEKFVDKKPSTVYAGEYTVSICKKDGLFEVFTVEVQKITGKKIVNWEDVR